MINNVNFIGLNKIKKKFSFMTNVMYEGIVKFNQTKYMSQQDSLRQSDNLMESDVHWQYIFGQIHFETISWPVCCSI